MESEPIFKVDVFVTSQEGVPDPNVASLTSELHDLGFGSAEVLSVGKTIRLYISEKNPESAQEIAQLASDKLLTNPVYQRSNLSIPRELEEKEIEGLNLT